MSLVDLRTKDIKPNSRQTVSQKSTTSSGTTLAGQIFLGLLGLALCTSFWMVVPTGERGVWMRFGETQEEIFAEGLHFVIPFVDEVQTLTTRVQKQETTTEASSKDLQEVFTEVSVNWHILPEKVNTIFQQIGDEKAVAEQIITPAIEEAIKAVMAHYTAEEIVVRRDQVKAEIDNALAARLLTYHLAVDEISLVNTHFSQQFREAVEAKQIAEQEAKQAEFIARKALRQAEMEINLARGKAEANRILKDTLTPNILKHQALQKWDGKLPLITDNKNSIVIEMEDLIEENG